MMDAVLVPIVIMMVGMAVVMIVVVVMVKGECSDGGR